MIKKEWLFMNAKPKKMSKDDHNFSDICGNCLEEEVDL